MSNKMLMEYSRLSNTEFDKEVCSDYCKCYIHSIVPLLNILVM